MVWFSSAREVDEEIGSDEIQVCQLDVCRLGAQYRRPLIFLYVVFWEGNIVVRCCLDIIFKIVSSVK